MIRKTVLSSLLGMIIASIIIMIPGCAQQNGDVIGKAVYTDIVAYINGYPIPSYNVDGFTVIVAEDLRNYGLDVTWDEAARTLSVTQPQAARPIQGMEPVYRYPDAVGKKFANILKTDILVFVNGSEVPSYSINGYTMIPLKSLSPYGSVIWNQEEWAAQVTIGTLEVNPTPAPVPEQSVNRPVIVLDPGHGKLSGGMTEAEKAADGWLYDAGKGGWGEWRHWKSGTVWQDCHGFGCTGRAPSGGGCWYPIGDGDRSQEPEITLRNVTYAAQYLEEMGYEVRLTRTSNDENPSMTKRLTYCYPNCDTSAQPDADLFVCIHSNAGGGRGSAYIELSGLYDQAGISGSYAYDGNTLGHYINDRIVNETSLGAYSGGVYRALPELVLFCKSPVTIAYLEVGFFDNASDLSILQSESAGIGRAIAEGIHQYAVDTQLKQ